MSKDKNNKINKSNILLVDVQIFLTICSTILFIMYLFNNKFIWLLEVVAGITLIDLAINNHIILKKEKFSFIYLIFGIIVFIFGVITLIGV